jgi:hypothetical protein
LDEIPAKIDGGCFLVVDDVERAGSGDGAGIDRQRGHVVRAVFVYGGPIVAEGQTRAGIRGAEDVKLPGFPSSSGGALRINNDGILRDRDDEDCEAIGPKNIGFACHRQELFDSVEQNCRKVIENGVDPQGLLAGIGLQRIVGVSGLVKPFSDIIIRVL